MKHRVISFRQSFAGVAQVFVEYIRAFHEANGTDPDKLDLKNIAVKSLEAWNILLDAANISIEGSDENTPDDNTDIFADYKFDENNSASYGELKKYLQGKGYENNSNIQFMIQHSKFLAHPKRYGRYYHTLPPR